MEVPPVAPVTALVAAVVAMSWAGPLVRLTDAPALAVAAWRLVFSVAVIGAILLWRRRATPWPELGRRDLGLAVAAGLLLAGHFWSWTASVALTSVASSVVLVSTQPIFVALLSAAFLGERPDRVQWAGILVAVGGAAVIGWGGLGRGPASLAGDLLALLGAVLVAGYYVIGRRLRPRMDLWSYTGTVYGVAAVALLAALLATTGTAAATHAPGDWLVFLALAAGPMLVGHTGVNYALRYLRAYMANVAVLAEPIGATLIAWLLPAIGEAPPVQTLVGGAFILAGIGLAVWRGAGGPGVSARTGMDVAQGSGPS